MEIILQLTINDIYIQTIIYLIFRIFYSEVKGILAPFIQHITCKLSLFTIIRFLFHPIISISKL